MKAIISAAYVGLSCYHAMNAELAPGLAYEVIATVYLVAYHLRHSK